MKKPVVSRKIYLMLALIFIFLGFKKPDEIFKLPNSIKKQFSFIPNTTIYNGSDTINTAAFYMSNFEVTNQDYNEFLNSLREEGKLESYELAKIDTNNWIKEFEESYMKPYSEVYHWHEAYSNYPVVNISLEGAMLYCQWLSKKLNAENQDLNYKIVVRLPSRDEWLSASSSRYNDAAYSWGSSYLRNKKGQFMCNFKYIGAESVAYNPEKNSYQLENSKINYVLDNALITAPVDAYYPNSFNLYNLNGNVAELVSDGLACGGSWNSTGYDVRNLSMKEYKKPSSMVGFRPLITLSQK